MKNRKDAVIEIQLVLVNILAKYWRLSYSDISTILEEYDIPEYIDLCYEMFNSTGAQGIINEIEDYIKLQGGTITKGNSAPIIHLGDEPNIINSIYNKAVYLIKHLHKKLKCDRTKAISTLIQTDTFTKLFNINSHFYKYTESELEVILENELKHLK